jgi:hypothetical protein
MDVFKTVESITIECVVENVSDLSTANCLFAIHNWKGENKIEKSPVIDGNKMNVKLLENETQLPDVYEYEFRIKVDDEVDSVYCGKLSLQDCVIKEMI